ncbi:uncharacterized protein BCR38DRAFT_407036 [Pseudomassariella vexata]|uniref:Rhodopsin domain-containing protein n=1 Tax=Pseudomassariella vexata TaxID=1141098 RepID=A0A1Y2E6W0_9PEZI|nr:uncharacterized protein BCR38DRAFT_407036 [Pseudomassariella vexata]ORY67016.1 hypothetical protein BCR38DRAFT_407036 [Pseudomassariella vexata]
MSDLSLGGFALLVCVYIFTVACTAILGLRFLAARLTRRRFYLDDGFVGLAYINTVVLGGCVIWAIYNGLGRHIIELNPQEIGVQFKLVVASGVTWLLGTVTIKMSMLCLYNRLFSSSTNTRRWASVLMVLVSCYGIAFITVFLTNCQPIDQMWNPVPDGWCRDLSIDEFVSVSINLVLDLSIVLLPMPVLWRMQMTTRKKVFISIMFGLGLVTIGIMCWRLEATVQSSKNPDFTFTLANIGLISMLELWLGIICACIPTLTPLLKTYVNPALKKIVSIGSSATRSFRGPERLKSVSRSRFRAWFTQTERTRQSRL